MMRPLVASCIAASALVVAGCNSCGDARENGATASASTSAAPSPPPIPSASVRAGVNPQDLPAYTGPTGSVEGTVLVDGDPAPKGADTDFAKCPGADAMYGKAFREGPARPDGKRPLADAVVGVTGYAGFYLPHAPEERKVVFDQCSFGARAFAMTFGDTLVVSNKSRLLVAPQFQEEARGAILIAPPDERGDPIKLTPPKPGHFTLFDQTRGLPYLKAHVYALKHPLHAVTDARGHFRIDGVPVGDLTVFARLAEIQKETSAPVKVVAGETTKVELVLHNTPVDAGAPSLEPGADAGRQFKLK